MHITGHKIFSTWYRMPMVIIIPAVMSIAMLVWAIWVNERHQADSAFNDTVLDLRIRTAMFHLWFEEAITNGTKDDIMRSLADLERAEKISDVILYGGTSEDGLTLRPLEDPELEKNATAVRDLFADLRKTTLARVLDPQKAGIGSSLDEQFDTTFDSILERTGILEVSAQRRLVLNHAKSRRLLFGAALVLGLIIAASIMVLYKWDFQRKEEEESLQQSRDELERRVNERTSELTDANRSLNRLYIQFQALLDAIPDSISLISPDLRTLWANRGAASAANSSDVTGHYCYTLWHKASEPCADCPAIKSFSTGKEEHMQVTNHNGSIWELRTFPLRGEDGGIESVLKIATNVTEKISMQAETMRAAHLASIGELAAGVAHEINNPINGIINYARIISNKSAGGSDENEIAERISKEGRRIAGIVRSLLLFSRDRKDEKRPSRLESILSESLTLTESQIRKEGILLRVDLPEGLPEVMVNEQQIQQVFMNIINNARYALNQKYPSDGENKVLDIICEEVTTGSGAFVRITFHDRGMGIAPEIMDKIMNPFFSTKPAGLGTGLGLTIGHSIIADHGGTLTVKSLKGEYTRVLIDLPAGGRNG